MLPLTEAANLEEALNTESRERFDLVRLVSSYVEGYQLTHPYRKFELDVRAAPLLMEGVQDHISCTMRWPTASRLTVYF